MSWCNRVSCDFVQRYMDVTDTKRDCYFFSSKRVIENYQLDNMILLEDEKNICAHHRPHPHHRIVIIIIMHCLSLSTRQRINNMCHA